jgi:hypothetical protein
MKRRIRRVVNFFAFNLLFFALYLNFIHSDKMASAAPDQPAHATASVIGTVPVAHPEKYLSPKSGAEMATANSTAKANVN